jgi:hypothetical protein
VRIFGHIPAWKFVAPVDEVRRAPLPAGTAFAIWEQNPLAGLIAQGRRHRALLRGNACAGPRRLCPSVLQAKPSAAGAKVPFVRSAANVRFPPIPDI